MGFSQIEFSPHIYIRSSPCRPNRDPNRTLSNELLLLLLSLIASNSPSLHRGGRCRSSTRCPTFLFTYFTIL